MKIILLLSTALLSCCIFSTSFAQTPSQYKGTFTNTSLTEDGVMTMSITAKQPDSISGYINFTELPNRSPLCGAGSYKGKMVGDSLFLEFTSSDTDSKCGYDFGWQFTIRARRYATQDSIAGAYRIANPWAETGTFNLRGNPVKTAVAIFHDEQAAIYPNPAHSKFTITLPNHVSGATATIINQLGATVFTQELHQKQTDLRLDLPEGVYFVRVASQNWKFAQKLVIRH